MATITSTTNGNWSAGATWVGGIAPVNGDKVYIAHTSSAGSTISTDAAGYAIGATAITMTGTVAAGSFVVGESVTFYGDPNYYPIAGWVSATKVLTIGGAGLIIAIPASSTRVTSRGHVVTVDGAAIEGGDDTTTAINVTGTLKWSRAATSQLTVQGELLILTKGTYDMGQSADPIPVAYTATLKTNRSAAPVDGKYGVTFQDNTGLYMYGATKTTNALLVSDIAVAATTARVTDGTGWAVGDRVIFGATGTVVTQQDVKTIDTITLVSGTIYDITWIGGTTYGHNANAIVGNFTNNVIITPYNTTYRSYFYALWNTVQPTNSREIRYVTFEELATNTSGGTFAKQAALTFFTSGGNTVTAPWISVGNLAFYQTLACSGLMQFGNNKERFTVSDIAMFSASGTSVLCYAGGVADFYRVNIYKGSTGMTYGYSEGMRNARWYDSVFTGCAGANVNFNGGINPEYYRCYFYSSFAGIYQGVANSAYFYSCYFGAGGTTPSGASFSQTYIVYSAVGNIGKVTLEDCYFDATKTITGSTYNQALPSMQTIVANKNVDPSAQEIYSPAGTIVRDNTSKVSGVTSLKMSPLNATSPLTFSVLIPAPTGNKIGVSGYLWRDTANVATVTLSGLGITPSVYTASGSLSANEQFFVSGTQTTGTDGLLTLTFSIVGTSGNMWVDAVSAPQAAAIDFGEFGFWSGGLPAAVISASYVSAGDVWNYLLANITVSGSIGKQLKDFARNVLRIG